MKPWERLATAPVSGGGELRLLRRGEEYSIRVDGHELMNSRVHGSEEALGDRGCERFETRKAPRVLVGGLGMGFTLAAVLRHLPDSGRVDVVELVPAVIQWNRDLLGHLAGDPLKDPRVSVQQRDVAEAIGANAAAYDAILLDVDNGPGALTRPANDGLYSRAGLDAALAALRPGGILAVWSVGPDRAFSERLRQAGFEVHDTRVKARGTGDGAWHTIWIAIRKG
jgi:spermidine synthase